MADFINYLIPGKAGSSYLCDASIDTEAWLTAKLGKGQAVEDSLDSDLDNGWDNGVVARATAENLFHKKHGGDFKQLVELCRDNVYNGENDFSQQFTFTVYGEPGADWLYDDVVVAVCLHLGGDVRGNYGPVQIFVPDYGLADCGFFDWLLGWSLVEGTLDCANPEEWQVGYTSNPTSQVETDLDDQFGRGHDGEWNDLGQYVVQTKENRVVIVPCEY